MAYFPFFVDFSGKEGLIVGGGTVALRKIEKLLPFGPTLTVCASALRPELREMSELKLRPQPFSPDLLEGKAFVIAATDDREVNHHVAACCRERGIPVNVVDDPAECTFLFPALVKRGDLTVGISTGGASPSAAVWVKERVEEILPERMDEILACLAELRCRMREKGESCSGVYAAAFEACIRLGRSLTDEEVNIVMKEKRLE